MRSPDPQAPSRLSDEQWAKITQHVPLPPAARVDIESGIEGYWRSKRLREEKPTAAEVDTRLQKVGKASKLIQSSIGAITQAEVTELRTSNFYWGPQFDQWPAEQLEAHIIGMLDSLAKQATAVEDLVNQTNVHASRYSRKSPQHVDSFVQYLGRVLERHGGPPLSRGKVVLSMIRAIFSIADPSASFEEAIRRLPDGSCGELPKKTRKMPRARRGGSPKKVRS